MKASMKKEKVLMMELEQFIQTNNFKVCSHSDDMTAPLRTELGKFSVDQMISLGEFDENVDPT